MAYDEFTGRDYLQETLQEQDMDPAAIMKEVEQLKLLRNRALDSRTVVWTMKTSES